MTKESAFRGDRGAAIQIDVKAVGDDGSIEGYGAIFDNVDQGGDRIVAGAFAKSLAATPPSAVKMLWQHDPTVVIGKWTDMVEDQKGLFVKGRLLTSVKAAQEAHVLLSEGAVDGLSIGYRAAPSGVKYDRSTGVRTLSELKLFEVSIVTFPMNEASRVSLVKAEDIDAINSLADAEDNLREAGFSRKEARDFISRVKRIAQREAGVVEHGPEDEVLAAIRKLTQSMRG